MVNDDGKIIEGYIYNKNLNYQTSSFLVWEFLIQ